ncbi:TIGR00341 family protein [Stenotrophomonas maltophilia]|nr:TIGR00341 family protein [Stenotrophomonas maltophilia]
MECGRAAICKFFHSIHLRCCRSCSPLRQQVAKMNNARRSVVRRCGQLTRNAARASYGLRERLIEATSHSAVMDDVTDGGGLSPRYAFMAVMSCGIAILGLLQSSAAVVIGAMLISPLMGPIVQLGFSLSVVDFRMMGRSLSALVCGVALALGTAMLIVWLSPLRVATSEILARTQPTLFDLLVAVFSGLAGGYAVITRKGEAIVGVAIATALMPPLAVVAYGLATGELQIAKGAGFLFMTNLLAIAFSVTVIARWYGFGSRKRTGHAMWQGAVIVGTFAMLAVPLGVALRDIGRQAWNETQVRSVVQGYLDGQGGSIQQLEVKRSASGLQVDLVAMVPDFHPDAQAVLQSLLAQRLPVTPRLRVRQTLEASDAGRLDRADLAGLRVAVGALSDQVQQMRSISALHVRERARGVLGDRLVALEVNAERLWVSATLLERAGEDEAPLALLQDALADALPGWRTVVRAAPAPAETSTGDSGVATE